MTRFAVVARHRARSVLVPLSVLSLLAACVSAGAPAQNTPEMSAASAATGVSAENIAAYSPTGAGMGGIVMAGMPNILFYKADTIDPAQLKAAPAHICAGNGVASAEDKPLEHPEEMPGVRKLVVACN